MLVGIFAKLCLYLLDCCRQKLRRLEVALIEYRESLEERGIKNPEEIERKVAIHRKRLESEYGLSDSSEDASGISKFSTFIYAPCALLVYRVISFRGSPVLITQYTQL